MRVFFTTNVERTREIWKEGWRDCYEEFGMRGVYASDTPLDANDDWDGVVTLTLEITMEVFEQYEFEDPGHPYREAIIPADVLDRWGTPEVYDHEFAGMSRRDLVAAASKWERSGRKKRADEMRAAIEFFDEIGWLTPVKVRPEPKAFEPIECAVGGQLTWKRDSKGMLFFRAPAEGDGDPFSTSVPFKDLERGDLVIAILVDDGQLKRLDFWRVLDVTDDIVTIMDNIVVGAGQNTEQLRDRLISLVGRPT